MNMEIEKKEYVAPAMTIVEMEVESSLLACSTGDDCFFSNDDDDLLDAL